MPVVAVRVVHTSPKGDFRGGPVVERLDGVDDGCAKPRANNAATARPSPALALAHS